MNVKAPKWLKEIQVRAVKTFADGYGQAFVDSDGYVYRAPDYQQRMGSLVAPHGFNRLTNGAWKASTPLDRTTYERLTDGVEYAAEVAEEVAKKTAGGFGLGLGLAAVGLVVYLLRK